MSTSDNNLLNFLQKQSLFNNSPNKNANRKMSSRSREKRSEQLWQGGANNTTFNQQTTATISPNINTTTTFNQVQGNSFTAGQNNASSFTAAQNTNSFTAGQTTGNSFSAGNTNAFGGAQINAGFSTGQSNATGSFGGAQISSTGFTAGQSSSATGSFGGAQISSTGFTGGQTSGATGSFGGAQINAGFGGAQVNSTGFTAAQSSSAGGFGGAQINAGFGGAQISANGFSAGQSSQSISAGQQISGGSHSHIQGGQSFGIQGNIQETPKLNIHANIPTNSGTSFHKDQYSYSDFKVQNNISSPTKQNVQASFQNNSNSFQNGNNFGSFSSNVKVNQTGNAVTTFTSYQEQIIQKNDVVEEPVNYLQNIVHFSIDSSIHARNEAMKRLDILGEKVRVQLSSLNSKFDVFNSQMMSIIVTEFNFVKNKVYELLEQTFRESETYSRGFISTVENEFSANVLTAKASLQKESKNIELMKVDICKPHWQSNAVFVSVQFEQRVNRVINQVRTMEVKSIRTHTNQSWAVNLKRDLLDRVIQRLQRERELAFGRPT